MYYFALLLGPESTDEPDAATQAEIISAYETFHADYGSAIRAGDALVPSATGARITGGADAPVITDGPFAEAAQVAGGYYVFEAENLDEALAIAAAIPACQNGAVEVWPMVEYMPPTKPLDNNWIALLLEPADSVLAPGTPEWNEIAGQHGKFAAQVGDRANGGAPLHLPSTATTVRMRDGELVLTDGPYIEGAEVANGYHILNVADRDEAIKTAVMIPATTIELRQLMGVSGL
ncbi:YciI family protein [Mycolicibacterium tusciae]|uniref:Transcription initiation protein n=1 Tax=Mycolicibacterium tusciae TaxID=75922 RepID=A0A1X0JVA8_9MYCO|nr:YciI family protein [Mycolicibacterium tusciae]ORB66731.1 transcription initiation protein [Mycolicibacterium tusciae]